MRIRVAFVVSLVVGVSTLLARHQHPAQKTSPAFEKLKSLVGV